MAFQVHQMHSEGIFLQRSDFSLHLPAKYKVRCLDNKLVLWRYSQIKTLFLSLPSIMDGLHSNSWTSSANCLTPVCREVCLSAIRRRRAWDVFSNKRTRPLACWPFETASRSELRSLLSEFTVEEYLQKIHNLIITSSSSCMTHLVAIVRNSTRFCSHSFPSNAPAISSRSLSCCLRCARQAGVQIHTAQLQQGHKVHTLKNSRRPQLFAV